MNLPQFSVVITIYNGSHIDFVLECFSSINNQTLLPTEVILVFDGPVNNEIADCCHNFLFKPSISKIIVETKVNKGPGVARNIGVEASSYDFVAIMDSDDVCYFDRFEVQLSLLMSEKKDVVGGHITEFKENFAESTGKPTRFIYLSDFKIKQHYKNTIPINNVTAMFRKQAFLSVGGYPNLRFGEDLVLWYRFIAHGYSFINVDRVLVGVRLGEGFQSRRTGFKILLKEFRYIHRLYKEGYLSIKELLFKLGKSVIVRSLPKKIYLYLRGRYN